MQDKLKKIHDTLKRFIEGQQKLTKELQKSCEHEFVILKKPGILGMAIFRYCPKCEHYTEH